MSIEKLLSTIKAEPMVFTIGLCVLLLAVMGTSVRHVSSAVFAILFLLSFSVIRDWRKIYLSLSSIEKMFLTAFLIFTISGVLSFYNADDKYTYYKLFERYMRFMLIIPVYLLMIEKKAQVIDYLFTGAVISGPFLLLVALRHYIESPDVPAQGYYHHIIFGQLAMLNVGMMLTMLLTKNMSRLLQLAIILSMLCGLVTTVMSQARGVWLVMPVYVAVAMYYAVRDQRIKKKYIAIFIAAFIGMVVFTPAGEVVKQRTVEAVNEVSHFYTQDQYISSVGTRLAMWDIAVNVWEQHPMLGTGPGDFDDEVMALQSKGEYKGMDIHNSVHNIFVQALVGSGAIGMIALIFSVVVMPLWLYLSRTNTSEEARLAGFITVTSFVVFGFSESWTLRLSATSIFLVYVIVIAAHVNLTRSNNQAEQ